MKKNECGLKTYFFGVMLSFMTTMDIAQAEVDSGTFDYKGYSPAGCTVTGGRAANLLVTREGVVYNSSTTSSLDVICPIIQDRGFGSSEVDISIVVTKPTTMSCFVKSRSNIATSGTSRSLNVTGTGTKTVNFENLPLGIHTVGCTLPKATSSTSGRTGILSYSVFEQ